MTLLWLSLALLCLLASGFYSGTEMGLYCVNRVRVRLRAERGQSRKARKLLRLIHRPQETVLGILLGTNLANYLLTVSGAAVIAAFWDATGREKDILVALILAPLVFVFGDVVPKNWFQADANRLMTYSAPILRGSIAFFRYTGVLWTLHQVTRIIVRITGHQSPEGYDNPRAEIAGLLREGGAYGALSIEQTRIIERVMNLSSVRVGAIMVPRRQVTTVRLDASPEQFRQVASRSRYSRMPVLGTDRRSIVGIVNIHDVLASQDEQAIHDRLQPPVFLRANESTTAALVHLRKKHATLAVVTDPRRGWVGIVTLKDIVEEIFGELAEW